MQTIGNLRLTWSGSGGSGSWSSFKTIKWQCWTSAYGVSITQSILLGVVVDFVVAFQKMQEIKSNF